MAEQTLRIAITYCRACHFTARATWVAQELLTTYGEWTESLALLPRGGGVFMVEVNGEVVFANKEAGRFPEIRELKEAINRFLEEPPKMAHE